MSEEEKRVDPFKEYFDDIEEIIKKGLEAKHVHAFPDKNMVEFSRSDEGFNPEERCAMCKAYHEHKKMGFDEATGVKVITPHPRPILRIEPEMKKRGRGIFGDMFPVRGAHEAIIFTPEHTPDLARLTSQHYKRA